MSYKFIRSGRTMDAHVWIEGEIIDKLPEGVPVTPEEQMKKWGRVDFVEVGSPEETAIAHMKNNKSMQDIISTTALNAGVQVIKPSMTELTPVGDDPNSVTITTADDVEEMNGKELDAFIDSQGLDISKKLRVVERREAIIAELGLEEVDDSEEDEDDG